MGITRNIGVTLLETAQAQKDVTMNEALVRLDAVINKGVLDRDVSVPPVGPAEGDMYIVAAGGSGDWSGHDGELAYFDQIWRFVTPQAGLQLYVEDEAQFIFYTGSDWQLAALRDEAVVVVAASTAAYALNIGRFRGIDMTLTDNCTLSFTSFVPAGYVHSLMLRLTQDATGGRTIAWPAAVQWAGGTAPTLTAVANASDAVALTTLDGGVTWVGQVIGLNIS